MSLPSFGETMNLSTSNITDSKFRKIAKRIVSDMRRLDVPGVAIGIWYKGKELTAGFGVTSVENPLPVTPDTLFQVGSISKTFTATLIMMLVEKGKIDIDAPVHRYLKDFRLKDKRAEKKVTVRHLLTHMGGWVGDYFNDFGNGDDALAKMVKKIANLPQIQPFGTIWSYSNTGFNIASRIIEVVTKKSYEQVVQEMIFNPLGLDRSYFYPSDILFTHRFVVGHQRVKEKIQVARPWAIGRAGNGVGGVVSNVQDLLKYARFHMGKGKRGVITAKSLRAMRVKQVSTGPSADMGITWFIENAGKYKVFEHGGSTKGQKAKLFFIPDKDFACTILTNSDDGGMITNNVYKLVMETYFKVHMKSPAPVDIPSKELIEYVGRYKVGTECIELKVRGKYLMCRIIPLGGFPMPDSPPEPKSPPFRFQVYKKDHFVSIDEPYKGALADAIRNERGKIEYFRFASRAMKKIK